MEKDCLQRLLEEGCGDARTFLDCGNTFLEKGNWERAIQAFDRAIELNPNDAIAFFNRGYAKSELNWKKRAIRDYDRAIELDPNDVRAFANRGNAKSDLGWHAKALEDYNRAIELDPNDVLAFTNRGTVKSDLGLQIAAIEDYDIAIKLDPNAASAFYNRGEAKMALGLPFEAKNDYFRTIFLEGNAIPLKPAVALLRHFHETYQFPYLVKHLLQTHPQFQTQLFHQTTIAENARQCRPLDLWLEWLAAQPNLPEEKVNWLQAMVHYHAGDPITAYQLLDQLDDGTGTDFMLQHFLLCSAEEILHPEREAIRQFAVQAASNFANTPGEDDDDQIFWAARLLTYADEPETALKCLKKGLPGDTFWHLARAAAFEASGESSRLSLEKVKEIADITGCPPEGNIARTRLPAKPDDFHWFDRVKLAAQFYDLEPLINREFGKGEKFPRFWEIWDTSDLETALREHLLAASLERLQKRFGDDLESIKSNPLRALVGTIQKRGSEQQETVNDLLLFFTLGEKIGTDELFFLRLYQLYCQHSGSLQAGAEEAHKVFLENLLAPTLEVLRLAAPLSAAIAGGIAQSLTALAVDFYAGASHPSSDGDTMEHYERFKTDFRSFIFNRIEAIGEEEFYRRYLIRGFDNF